MNVITYRVGDHAQFKESLMARLSAFRFRALRDLTTREHDDFTIAFLDAWSVVSDVLTFYQERIANESYLGTATEEVSVVELARFIGYELRPGVAAGTYLAFTLDGNAGVAGMIIPGAPGSKSEPSSIGIESGTKVQSIPGPDEDPQTFETIEKIEVRAEWNTIKPIMVQPQLEIVENQIVIISGTDNDLQAGDVVLIEEKPILSRILKVVIKEDPKTTWLYLEPEATFPISTLPVLNPGGEMSSYPEKVDLYPTIIRDIISKIWAEEDLMALILAQGWSVVDLKDSISKELTKQAASEGKIFVFRKRASVFGYNALKQMTFNDKGSPLPPSSWDEWELNEDVNKIYLDSTYEQILPGSYIAVQQPNESLAASQLYKAEGVDHRSRTDYGISSKTTVISISPSPDEGWWGGGNQLSDIRSVTIYAQAAPLVLAESPITEPVTGDKVMLERLYLGLKKGQKIILSGEREDLFGVSSSELKILKEVFVVKGVSVLVFEKPLAHSYIRKSVIINANIAAATHGETVQEILGSGDATKSFQKFILRQSPLTFVSAATPSGTKSTLEIRVNDLLWREVPSLYEHGPGEHIYITRQDDHGKTKVVFGDGKNGARLPSGPENVKALYRKGIGVGGLLKPDQLSQLITRPLGVKAVNNPFKTSGAEDRERLKDAKRNATLTIFTLGRIVSLQDYEDFARSFAGISKALATWTWTGKKRSIHVTVAGYNGAMVDTEGQLYQNLLTAIRDAGIPEVPLMIDPFQERFFHLTARVQVHPDFISALVFDNIKQQLRGRFSFQEREFGQPVSFSEVIAVIQNVDGVTAVDIEEFYRSDKPAGIQDIILAEAPRPGRDKAFPAELITIDPRPINLQLM